MTSITPLRKNFEYTRAAQGPYVGKICIYLNCDTYARYVVTPQGHDPAESDCACGKHVPVLLTEMFNKHNLPIIVQEIPRLARDKSRAKRGDAS